MNAVPIDFKLILTDLLKLILFKLHLKYVIVKLRLYDLHLKYVLAKLRLQNMT